MTRMTFSQFVHQLCKFLDWEALLMVTHDRVTSWMDYCDALYTGLPLTSIQKLQLMQNVVVQTVMCAPQMGLDSLWDCLFPVTSAHLIRTSKRHILCVPGSRDFSAGVLIKWIIIFPTPKVRLAPSLLTFCKFLKIWLCHQIWEPLRNGKLLRQLHYTYPSLSPCLF